MATTKKPSRVSRKRPELKGSRLASRLRKPTLNSPHVIFEILFVDGMLWMVVRNIGAKPAFHIRIHFEQPFNGLEGTKRMDTLPLFTHLEFLGPAREIKTLLDRSSAYFCRHEPLRITARVRFEEETTKKYETLSIHNLEVFRELGSIYFHPPSRLSAEGKY